MKKGLIFGVFLLVIMLVFVTACGGEPQEPITNFATADGNTLGSPDAQVVIYEFSDYDCPYCKMAESTVYNLVKEYGDNIRIEYKQFVVHQEAWLASEAALCAAEQNKFWDYHSILFENQGKFSINELNKYAKQVEGMDTNTFSLCLLKHEMKEAVEADMAFAEQYNVKATPTFVINGQVVEGLRESTIINFVQQGLEGK